MSAASGLANVRGGADHCRIEEFIPVSAAKRAQYAKDDTDTETCLCISCDATPAIDQDLLQVCLSNRRELRCTRYKHKRSSSLCQ
ncbi:hypothetical protein QQF64_008217 [Cirrhinus molitorella]|uniref:Uncharacterized protein n=1 Tax=Cirrhinus molitorella TaxID=172907 RepID=A0ABR3M5K6_9TELE